MNVRLGGRGWHIATGVAAGLLCLLATGCAIQGSAAPVPLNKTPEAQPDRGDCGEIYGTAFRSGTEKEWFQINCSKWPLVAVPESPAATAGQPQAQARPDSPECAAMRGRPYANDAERTWFLQNCGGTVAPAQPGSPVAPAAPVAPAGPDRANCDEIRGTPYRSANERNWYLRYCQPAPQPGPSQPVQAAPQVAVPVYVGPGVVIQQVPQQPGQQPRNNNGNNNNRPRSRDGDGDDD